MPAANRHYLLYSEATSSEGGRLRWKFVLQSVDGNDRFSASDAEGAASASRLELLAVVRGLEALDQPSQVTLLTCSKYVSRGIRRGLREWREKGWRWERFGQLVPVRDHDLWRRVDRALEFHQVQCWSWHTEESASGEIGVGEFQRATHAASHEAESALPVELWQRRPQDREGWSIAAMLEKLTRGVLTPISAIWRPPFTRAA
jgi:ribonuclease HI